MQSLDAVHTVHHSMVQQHMGTISQSNFTWRRTSTNRRQTEQNMTWKKTASSRETDKYMLTMGKASDRVQDRGIAARISHR